MHQRCGLGIRKRSWNMYCSELLWWFLRWHLHPRHYLGDLVCIQEWCLFSHLCLSRLVATKHPQPSRPASSPVAGAICSDAYRSTFPAKELTMVQQPAAVAREHRWPLSCVDVRCHPRAPRVCEHCGLRLAADNQEWRAVPRGPRGPLPSPWWWLPVPRIGLPWRERSRFTPGALHAPLCGLVQPCTVHVHDGWRTRGATVLTVDRDGTCVR